MLHVLENHLNLFDILNALKFVHNSTIFQKLKGAIEESKRLVPVYCKLSDSLK